jgi:hypothetical protein
VSSAILRISSPLDEAAPLELVEEADEVATVVAEGVGDHRLRLTGLLLQEHEHRVVLRRQARRIEGLHRAVPDLPAETLEEERRAREELPRRTGPTGLQRSLGVDGRHRE